jgi:hypothetical protein
VSKCKYGDPYCPCEDGDGCLYEAPDPLPIPEPCKFCAERWRCTPLCARTARLEQTLGTLITWLHGFALSDQHVVRDLLRMMEK